jgi:hypothetical protein
MYYNDDIWGIVNPFVPEAPNLGEVVRDGAAELGIEKGQGSPWKNWPAERP